MNLDDRLRSAYQNQLRTAEESFADAAMPDFGSSGQSPRVRLLAVAAAIVLLVIGFGPLSTALRNNESEVRLETATTSPVASQPETDDATGDAGAGDVDASGTGRAAVVPPLTVTVTPTPTATPDSADNGQVDVTPDPAPSPVVVEPATPDPDRENPDPAHSNAGTQDGQTADPDIPNDDPSTALTPEPTPTTAPSGSDSSAPEPSSVATPVSDPEPSATVNPTSTPAATAVPAPTATATPVPTATPSPAPTATATPVPTVTATPEPTATPTPVYPAGVANSVCPSGRRADLQQATLRYVGENTGWGRLDDLVDEQDGPFYFEAWEPGYPNSVTVEIVLAEPVLAADIRVAQDPFTPVSGDIGFTSPAGSFWIALAGVDGWRTYTFAEPVVLDRFTINRDQADENIMEVLVCLRG